MVTHEDWYTPSVRCPSQKMAQGAMACQGEGNDDATMTVKTSSTMPSSADPRNGAQRATATPRSGPPRQASTASAIRIARIVVVGSSPNQATCPPWGIVGGHTEPNTM